jgi:L-ascorbate metabolism protein UlaG (beta-lactamase superfamily)
MNTGGTVDLGGFSVSLVRADHSAGMVEAGVTFPLGSPNGIVVKAPGEPTVYHMGDTDIFGDMALIAEIHQPKVGLVPIGDRFTMGARTAALAVKRFFQFDTVIPCHYGSFGIIDATAEAFVAEMAGARTKVVVPAKGESVAV